MYRSLKRQHIEGEEGELGLIWNWAWLPDQEHVDQLSAEQKRLLYGPQPAAKAYSYINIRGSSFRTFPTEQLNKYNTQDSGMAVMHEGAVMYGRMMSIWEVTYGIKIIVLLNVDLFEQSFDDNRFSGGIKVRCAASMGRATISVLVSPDQVMQQVFFGADPEDDGYLLVFKLLSSAYSLPSQMIDLDGNLQL